MMLIAITPAAFDAVVATLPFSSTPYEPEPNEKGERVIWLDESVANKLRAARGPGESYSDVILRLFEMETR
jgi:Putative antitoxin